MKIRFSKFYAGIATFILGVASLSFFTCLESKFFEPKEIENLQDVMQKDFDEENQYISLCDISSNSKLYENQTVKIRQSHLSQIVGAANHTRYGSLSIGTKCGEKNLYIGTVLENEDSLKNAADAPFFSPEKFEVKIVGRIKIEPKILNGGFFIIADSVEITEIAEFSAAN